jgi:hypothetical protein
MHGDTEILNLAVRVKAIEYELALLTEGRAPVPEPIDTKSLIERGSSAQEHARLARKQFAEIATQAAQHWHGQHGDGDQQRWEA